MILLSAFLTVGDTPKYSSDSRLIYFALVAGSDNSHVATGLHSEKFKDRIGKTHFAGLLVRPGDIWQASRTFNDFTLNAW